MRQDSLLTYILKTVHLTDLQTVQRHTVLRALCARAAKSIGMSPCLLVCVFVCNKTTLAFT